MRMLIRRFIPLIILGCAVLFGAIGRGTALYSWDGDHTLHPDERFLVYTVLRLQVPDQWQSYGDNDCVVDGKVPTPSATRDLRGVERAPHQWEPSRTSGCNSLNPRNFGWSERFVYGALPTTLVRVASDVVFGRDATPLEIRNTGRTLAWLSDLIAIVLVYWLARAVLPARASAWAAVLYALAPLPIQLSHFFTVDALLSPWVVAALGLALRLERQRWRDWLLFALCVAIAGAMRITMVSLAGLALVVWVRQMRPLSWRMSGLVFATACVGVGVLRVSDPTWWQDGWFESRWVADIMAAGRIVAGAVDTPPTFQWADAVPWIYPLWQLSWWGLGVPVTAIALYGIWLTVRRRWRPAWLLVVWVGIFFVWQGGVFGMTMRYYLPIYAGLSVLAVSALCGVGKRWRRRVLAVMIGASVVSAVAWQQMYAEPHPRIAASAWMYAQIPAGATIAVEHWDDALPLVTDDNRPGRYRFVELPVFDADRPSKFVTVDDTQPGMIAQIAEADYIVLSSARGYAVIPKMPLRFPVTQRYYSMLFDGRLGYELVYRAERWPHIGTWWRDTRHAEEALSVYDHPQVMIFANRARLDAPTIANRLLADVRWSDVAHAPTTQYRLRPDMGLIDDATWQSVAQSQWSWRGQGGWVTWLLMVDGLMLLLVPWLRRWRDHGVTIGRAVGMLLLIGVSGLALPLGTIMLGLAAVLPVAVWGWWRRWRQIVTQVRQQWRLVLSGELLWLMLVGLGMWWAGGASHPNDWWRQVAIIQQQMTGVWPVVAEPWLAGFAVLDGGSVLRAAALLGMVSGSDGHHALTLLLATATGVMAQGIWYVAYGDALHPRQYIWRVLVIVGVLSAANLFPVVRAVLGDGDPLWAAVQTPDGAGWVPTTWAIAMVRADSAWVWQSVWWGVVGMMVWRREWWLVALMGVVGLTFAREMWWWMVLIGSAVALWYGWRQRLGWLMLMVLLMVLRTVEWQMPQGSATVMLLHLWPWVGLVGLIVWRQPQPVWRDTAVAGLWTIWGLLSAWMQLPLWLLLVGWGVCAALLGRRYGGIVWYAIGLLGGISLLPVEQMIIGYQLVTLVTWGYLAWLMMAHVRHTWWLAPALLWLVWSSSIARPTLSQEEQMLAEQIRMRADASTVVVDTEINRAQRLAAASGGVLWVAPPTQLDARWLELGWRDAIRQRWQQTLQGDRALLCAADVRIDVVVTQDTVVWCADADE